MKREWTEEQLLNLFYSHLDVWWHTGCHLLYWKEWDVTEIEWVFPRRVLSSVWYIEKWLCAEIRCRQLKFLGLITYKGNFMDSRNPVQSRNRRGTQALGLTICVQCGMWVLTRNLEAALVLALIVGQIHNVRANHKSSLLKPDLLALSCH